MGKINYFWALCLFFTMNHAQSEPLSKHPDWLLEPVQEGWFLLWPPDDRKPIVIPASAAKKLTSEAVNPDTLYRRFTQQGTEKKKDENVWKKNHGFYVQDDKSESGSDISSMSPNGSSEENESQEAPSGTTVFGAGNTSSLPPSNPSQKGNSSGSSTFPSGTSSPTESPSANTGTVATEFNKPTGSASANGPANNQFLNDEAAKAKVVIGQNKMTEIKGGATKSPPPQPTCDNAKSLGVLKEETKDLNFPATTSTCNFASGDNLDRRNGYVTARREQSKSFEIPAKAVICEFSLSSDSTAMRYDDHYMFTFNGYILSSNLTTALDGLDVDTISVVSGDTTKSVTGKKYNWLKIRGKEGQDSKYCISDATCQWPATEQQGAVNIQINSELAKGIASKSSTGNQEFQYIISGDDNDSDCQHSGLQLKAKLKYYIP